MVMIKKAVDRIVVDHYALRIIVNKTIIMKAINNIYWADFFPIDIVRTMFFNVFL